LNRSFPLLVTSRTFARSNFYYISLPAGAVFEDVLPRLVLRVPLALGCGLVPSPLQVLAGEAVTRLSADRT
jgi:hypothetical protein